MTDSLDDRVPARDTITRFKWGLLVGLVVAIQLVVTAGCQDVRTRDVAPDPCGSITPLHGGYATIGPLTL